MSRRLEVFVDGDVALPLINEPVAHTELETQLLHVAIEGIEVLMVQHSFKGSDCRAWLVPESRACNVDTPIDLIVAEQLLLRNREHDYAS